MLEILTIFCWYFGKLVTPSYYSDFSWPLKGIEIQSHENFMALEFWWFEFYGFGIPMAFIFFHNSIACLRIILLSYWFTFWHGTPCNIIFHAWNPYNIQTHRNSNAMRISWLYNSDGFEFYGFGLHGFRILMGLNLMSLEFRWFLSFFTIGLLVEE